MVVPRHAGSLHETLVLGRGFEHCAAVELSDTRTLHFLPRRLAGRNRIAAGLLQLASCVAWSGLTNEAIRTCANPDAAARSSCRCACYRLVAWLRSSNDECSRLMGHSCPGVEMVSVTQVPGM